MTATGLLLQQERYPTLERAILSQVARKMCVNLKKYFIIGDHQGRHMSRDPWKEAFSGTGVLLHREHKASMEKDTRTHKELCPVLRLPSWH